MDQETKQGVHKRVRRIAGQVSGIERMIADDRYCVDVLQQIAAVRAALGKVSGLLLESHIQTCVKGTFDSDDPSDQTEKIAELVSVFNKNCKC